MLPPEICFCDVTSMTRSIARCSTDFNVDALVYDKTVATMGKHATGAFFSKVNSLMGR
jgi:hypothetical protein